MSLAAKSSSFSVPRTLLANSIRQLKTGRVNPNTALQLCYQILRLPPVSYQVHDEKTCLLLSSNQTIETSAAFFHRPRVFTNSFSSLVVPFLTPDQVMNLISIKENGNASSCFWWQQVNGAGCSGEHAQLSVALLKRASVFRNSLTTTQLARCVRVAISRFGGTALKRSSDGGEKLLLTFYGQLVEELTSRMNNSSANNQKLCVSSLSSSELLFPLISEVAVELLHLAKEIRQLISPKNSASSKLGNLEHSILVFADEVLIARRSDLTINKLLEEYFLTEEEFSAGMEERNLINSLKQQHQFLMTKIATTEEGKGETKQNLSQNHQAESRNNLACLLREAESQLHSSTTSTIDFNIDNKLQFISTIASAPLQTKQDAAVIARSLVSLAFCLSHGSMSQSSSSLTGDEKKLLSETILTRHGFLVDKIQGFFHEKSTKYDGGRCDEVELIFKTLPNAIAILSSNV